MFTEDPKCRALSLQDHTESLSRDEVVGQLVRTELEDTGVPAMNISIQEKFQHILIKYALIHNPFIPILKTNNMSYTFKILDSSLNSLG